MWKIHDVFHAALLSLYKETTTHGPNFISPPLIMIKSKEEYEVDKIISHKGPPRQQKYLTAWKGYPLSENTWEPKSNLHHAKQILTEYKTAHHVNFLHTCLSPPNLMHPPNSSYPQTFPGLLDSTSINLNSCNSTTFLLTTPKSTCASAPKPVAPSTTEPRMWSLFVSTPLVHAT